MTEQLKIIEQNHLGHFAFLPKTLGFEIREINDVTIINCGLNTSMFNIAYGSPQGPKTSNDIREIKQAFAGQSFALWIPPSQYNPKITKTLLETNLIIENVEHAMICNLVTSTSLTTKTDLIIKRVIDISLLQDFLQVIKPYDTKVQEFYKKISNKLLSSCEQLVVGYINNHPVVVGILFIKGNNAGIFSLITSQGMRRNGYGNDMMIFLMNLAKKSGCKFVTLSASSDSGYRIYENLGFRTIGEFECFEYKGTSI